MINSPDPRIDASGVTAATITVRRRITTVAKAFRNSITQGRGTAVVGLTMRSCRDLGDHRIKPLGFSLAEMKELLGLARCP